MKLLVFLLLSLGVSSESLAQSKPRASIFDLLASTVYIESDKGSGSGVLVNSDAFVITAYHVIDEVKSLKIKTSDGRSFPTVRVLGTDELNDLAVLQIFGDNLPFVTMGDTEKLLVGDPIYAVGAPKGLEGTVTKGIVSAKRKSQTSFGLLQIDAAISPGSSGGGIFNEDGHLVGIAVATLRESQNINFAIPIESAVQLLQKSGEYLNDDQNSDPFYRQDFPRYKLTQGERRLPFANDSLAFHPNSNWRILSKPDSSKRAESLQMEHKKSSTKVAVLFKPDTTVPFELLIAALSGTAPWLPKTGLDVKARGSRKVGNTELSWLRSVGSQQGSEGIGTQVALEIHGVNVAGGLLMVIAYQEGDGVQLTDASDEIIQTLVISE